MSHSISTLLIRNLSEICRGKRPHAPSRCPRRALARVGVFYDPNKGVFRGRDERSIPVRGHTQGYSILTFNISRSLSRRNWAMAGTVRWVSGTPGQAPAYGGTDFLIARDGRIAALYLFSKLP